MWLPGLRARWLVGWRVAGREVPTLDWPPPSNLRLFEKELGDFAAIPGLDEHELRYGAGESMSADLRTADLRTHGRQEDYITVLRLAFAEVLHA